jgi:hypothetical protein
MVILRSAAAKNLRHLARTRRDIEEWTAPMGTVSDSSLRFAAIGMTGGCVAAIGMTVRGKSRTIQFIKSEQLPFRQSEWGLLAYQ